MYQSVRLLVRGPPATGRRKKEEEKKEHLARTPLLLRVARARSRFFSHARRRGVSPRGEKDRGDLNLLRLMRMWSYSRIALSNFDQSIIKDCSSKL
ncbi:hypothetical protein BHM03_00023669 [Ensete ventricosum]|uniref:Uncharacterized protein n=1 Tax=Ensete ventricosum TaxID=4639 RepID=A0A445MGL3_ENSVE|nr:hypothetical protein BHM03_00023669 [Ensete ventricosum]